MCEDSLGHQDRPNQGVSDWELFLIYLATKSLSREETN